MLIRFVREVYHAQNRTLTLYVVPLMADLYGEFAEELGDSSEDLGDLRAPEGLINFAASKYGDLNASSLEVISGKDTLSVLPFPAFDTGGGSTPAQPGLMPGVTVDLSSSPLVSVESSEAQKQQAVLQVAKSQLGVPYIWGHSEDTGHQGFDHSSFVQFVYRRALGYRFSRIAREQAARVGRPVTVSEMRAGDLLIFSGGSHVGLYAGDDRMISQGGGRGHIGYLRVGPGSYWRRRLTAVKRMF